jgi:hypothetical protein
MMSLPVSFKLPKERQGEVGQWLVKNGSVTDVTYDWVRGILTFGTKEDASAFTLVFGILRHETQIEKMLKYEESHN